MNDNGNIMRTLFSRAHATFSGFGRDVNLLLTATGILAISFFGIQMLLKILYVLRLGYGPAYLGMFNAAGALGYMAMSLPAGALGARLGLKRAMTMGVTVSMLGVAMLPFTEFVPLQAQTLMADPLAVDPLRRLRHVQHQPCARADGHHHK